MIEIQFIILEFWKEGGLVKGVCAVLCEVSVLSQHIYQTDFLSPRLKLPHQSARQLLPSYRTGSKVLHMQSSSTRMDPWIVCINGHI